MDPDLQLDYEFDYSNNSEYDWVGADFGKPNGDFDDNRSCVGSNATTSAPHEAQCDFNKQQVSNNVCDVATSTYRCCDYNAVSVSSQENYELSDANSDNINLKIGPIVTSTVSLHLEFNQHLNGRGRNVLVQFAGKKSFLRNSLPMSDNLRNALWGTPLPYDGDASRRFSDFNKNLPIMSATLSIPTFIVFSARYTKHNTELCYDEFSAAVVQNGQIVDFATHGHSSNLMEMVNRHPTTVDVYFCGKLRNDQLYSFLKYKNQPFHDLMQRRLIPFPRRDYLNINSLMYCERNKVHCSACFCLHDVYTVRARLYSNAESPPTPPTSPPPPYKRRYNSNRRRTLRRSLSPPLPLHRLPPPPLPPPPPPPPPSPTSPHRRHRQQYRQYHHQRRQYHHRSDYRNYDGGDDDHHQKQSLLRGARDVSPRYSPNVNNNYHNDRFKIRQCYRNRRRYDQRHQY